ncbi:MAG: putative Ig domain-containing protein, partial [Planctomycetota bacterium]|nr:putative Ig domain-containing protein [Planctomycetota bacterium]
APYPVSGDLAWSLENLTTSMQVQSGIVPFLGSSTATVTLAPISVEDPYRLTGYLTGSSNQATADLQISSIGLTFTALPPSGTLVNSLFDVEVTVEDTMTGAPVVPSPPFDITLDVGAGAGTLSGVLTLTATTAFTTFTGLSYDTTDSLDIRSQSPRTATVLAGPIAFDVDIQANPASLGTVRPGDPIPAVLFTLFDGLGAQYASTGDLDWTLTDLTAPAVVQSGTESFGGTAIATVVLSPITVQGPYQLDANLVGSGNLASVDLSIASIRLTFTSLPPAGTLVNSPFSVEITVVDDVTGAPRAPVPPIDITLSKASGTGTLSGTLTQNVSTATATFPGLAYDSFDSLDILAGSQRTASIQSGPISFEVDIQANPTSLGTILSGDPIPPVQFMLLDGLGAPFVSTGDLEWRLVDLTTVTTVQSGTEPFSGTDTVTVNAAPVLGDGPYRLAGNHVGSLNEAFSDLTIMPLNLQDLPGPFVALKSVRVGQTYSDDVSFAVPAAFEWMIGSGSIPSGISLDSGTGALTGVPTTPTNGEFTLYARTSPTDATPIRCALAVFSTAETEWVPGQSFIPSGPLATVSTTDSTTFTSSFDSQIFTTNLEIFHPPLAAITSPLPLFVHHRGRGFHYTEYSNLLSRIAAYGFICVSVEDYQSFFEPLAPAPDPVYDQFRAELGMQSGSAFQEGAINHMIARSQTPGDQFENKIDETKVFVGGHSRGGGSTHGSHTRGLDIKINGVIYFMPFDLRFFFATIPPGTAPAYGIPDIQPRLPSLMITAENDGDLVYPYGDQLIERASGQGTAITVYGANHNNLGDAHPPDGLPYISRQEEQDYIVNQCVAFLKRWGELDLSLEGFLYGNEHRGSRDVGVASLKNHVESILVDDYQDIDPSTNSQGGINSMTGGFATEASVYPLIGSFWSLGIRNNILSFTSTTATFTTNIPGGMDLTGRKRLIFRCGQTTFQGYDWVTFQVRLTDTSAETATVTLFDRAAPSTIYLPDFVGGDPRVYDRFVEVQVDLTEFTVPNPALDLNSLSSIQLLFDFAAPPLSSDQIYIDDLRFE